MLMNIEVISETTCERRCLLPSGGLLPGSVTSSASRRIRSEVLRDFSSLSFASSISSTIALRRLPASPIRGLSSGGACPIDLKSAVTEPFLPSSFTRASLTSSRLEQDSTAERAPSNTTAISRRFDAISLSLAILSSTQSSSARLWRTASNITTAAAVATLSDSAWPGISMLTVSSSTARLSSEKP